MKMEAARHQKATTKTKTPENHRALSKAEAARHGAIETLIAWMPVTLRVAVTE
jgi:hypothetical protein